MRIRLASHGKGQGVGGVCAFEQMSVCGLGDCDEARAELGMVEIFNGTLRMHKDG